MSVSPKVQEHLRHVDLGDVFPTKKLEGVDITATS
jgi:hypothetical protein